MLFVAISCKALNNSSVFNYKADLEICYGIFFTESGTGLQGFEDKEKSEQQHHPDDKQ